MFTRTYIKFSLLFMVVLGKFCVWVPHQPKIKKCGFDIQFSWRILGNIAINTIRYRYMQTLCFVMYLQHANSSHGSWPREFKYEKFTWDTLNLARVNDSLQRWGCFLKIQYALMNNYMWRYPMLQANID